ncbi:YciC family protein [Orbus wheelerorum]|uniref:YciC family protein n=1 Tax=Orbus wheelerorum TaxID=3074111 RepID=UPI00370D2292
MLSFSSLLSDTKNFISNNLLPIIITVLSIAIIERLITFFFYPSVETIEPIRQLIEQAAQKYGDQLSPEALSQTILALSEQEQLRLIPAVMDYLIRVGIIFLVVNLLSMSVILSLIYTISYQQLSLSNMLKNISRIATKIILFMLLAIPGFIGLSLIVSIIPPLAIPLIIIAILFYVTAYVAFLAVIIEPVPQYGFIKKLKIGLTFLKQKIRLILPIIAIWFLATLLLDSLAGLLIANMVVLVIFDALKLLLTVMTLCYLYRLYSLSNKE